MTAEEAQIKLREHAADFESTLRHNESAARSPSIMHEQNEKSLSLLHTYREIVTSYLLKTLPPNILEANRAQIKTVVASINPPHQDLDENYESFALRLPTPTERIVAESCVPLTQASTNLETLTEESPRYRKLIEGAREIASMHLVLLFPDQYRPGEQNSPRVIENQTGVAGMALNCLGQNQQALLYESLPQDFRSGPYAERDGEVMTFLLAMPDTFPRFMGGQRLTHEEYYQMLLGRTPATHAERLLMDTMERVRVATIALTMRTTGWGAYSPVAAHMGVVRTEDIGIHPRS